MSHRTLIRGGHVLTMDPADRRPAARRRPHRGRQDRRGRSRTSSADAEVVDAAGRIVHPRLRRHPPAHLGGRDPRLRAERHPGRLLRRGAGHVRPALPARGRLRAQPGRLAGVPQRRHHHAGRLVAHQQHPGAPGRRRSRALQETGIRAQYAYGSANTSLADYWFESKIAIPGDDVRRIRDTYFSSDDGLLTMALATRGPGLLQRRRGAGRVGAGPRAGHPDHRARRRWAGWPAGSA